MSHKWEYKVDLVKPGMMNSGAKGLKIVEDRLNRLGLEGWELVGTPQLGEFGNFTLYLKRSR